MTRSSASKLESGDSVFVVRSIFTIHQAPRAAGEIVTEARVDQVFNSEGPKFGPMVRCTAVAFGHANFKPADVFPTRAAAVAAARVRVRDLILALGTMVPEIA